MTKGRVIALERTKTGNKITIVVYDVSEDAYRSACDALKEDKEYEI